LAHPEQQRHTLQAVGIVLALVMGLGLAAWLAAAGRQTLVGRAEKRQVANWSVRWLAPRWVDDLPGCADRDLGPSGRWAVILMLLPLSCLDGRWCAWIDGRPTAGEADTIMRLPPGILVVEDDPTTARLVELLLTSLASACCRGRPGRGRDHRRAALSLTWC